ncbi:MAG: CDP-diacylglycerol--serine O-phosphatidyltransferase, partial [Bryobacteraceae bacterium]
MAKLDFMPPRSKDRRPNRAAYALPTMFTAGNIFLGFLAILKAFEGAIAAKTGGLGPNADFEAAAQMIGAA